jgi:hypothetical protein
MQNLISIFNSRELAILTLVFAGILVAIFFKQPRSLLWDFFEDRVQLAKNAALLVDAHLCGRLGDLIFSA